MMISHNSPNSTSHSSEVSIFIPLSGLGLAESRFDTIRGFYSYVYSSKHEDDSPTLQL
jgi:hypothetical protein